jgi:hypothetical protein
LRRKAAQNIISWFATGKPEYVVTRGSGRLTDESLTSNGPVAMLRELPGAQ